MIPSLTSDSTRLRHRLDMLNMGLAVAVFVSFGFTLAPTSGGRFLPLSSRPTVSLASAIDMSDVLMTRSVTLQLQSADGKMKDVLTLSLPEHAEWVLFDEKEYSFDVDEHLIAEFLRTHPLFSLDTARVFDATQEWVLQGTVEGTAQSGWAIDHAHVAHALARALMSGDERVAIETLYKEAEITYESAGGPKQLTRLSTGKSNFEGSALGRAANVRKALTQHLNGVIVPAGEEFSFNDTIADSGGWHDSYVIMNGKDLVLEKGGGICQAATTMFRAALLAGLPIIDRANHSLYVTYYKDYGMGIDATIYPGKQDFTFTNDTPDDIVILARNDGDEAIIELYGVSDGRSVAMEGPYFAQNAPESFLVSDRELKTNEVAWEHEVVYADGRVVTDTILSRYLALPRKLHEEYVAYRGIEELLLPPTYWTETASATGETVVMR